MEIVPIVEFIKKKRAAGLNDEDIKKQLLEVGWTTDAIEKAYNFLNTDTPLPPIASVKSASVKEETMWSAFQNILTFISLSFFSVSLHLLWSIFIDRWFPDKVYTSIRYFSANNFVINSALAGLVVSAPFFIGLFFLTNQKYSQNPDLKKHGSKKILNYLTLIITFFILLIRLISAVTTALNNAFTVLFGMNLLITFITIGTIFAYYLYEVRYEKKALTTKTYVLSSVILTLIFMATLVYGFSLRVKPADQPKPVPLLPNSSYVTESVRATRNLLASSTNTPIKMGQVRGIDITIEKAQLFAENTGTKILEVDVVFAANIPCPLTGGSRCGTNSNGFQGTDAEGFILERLHLDDPKSLKSDLLSQGQKSKGKVFFQVESISNLYYITYNDSSEKTQPVAIQMNDQN